MMQVIDEAYVREIIALPDGTDRIARWIFALLEERDTALVITKSCVEQIQPLKRRADDLLAANSRLVFEKRDLRFEMQAELDAAHAELDEHRRGEVPDTSESLQLLDWLQKRPDLDLAYQYDIGPIPQHLMKPGPIPEDGWCVHKRNGNPNDREWTMVSIEATPLEALRSAHKAFCDGR